MTETQVIETVWQSSGSRWSDITRLRAPLGTSVGPIAPAATGPGDISVFAVVPQANNHGEPADYALEITRWRAGKLPDKPAGGAIPVRPPAETEPQKPPATRWRVGRH